MSQQLCRPQQHENYKMAQKQESSANGNCVTTNCKLTGKTVVITGANTGIGLETAIDLAKRDAKVIIACRNMERGENARKRIVEESHSENVTLKELDLSSLDSVREFAENINRTEERLDILINNAGVMMCPQSETKDGFEMQFGVNHLGHFLLTNKLLDLIKKSSPSRIVTVSSSAHNRGQINWDDLNHKTTYQPWTSYSQSKLMNVLFSRELSQRLAGTGVTSNSLHPGVVNTELGRHMGNNGGGIFISAVFKVAKKMSWLFLRTPKQGAQTSIYCAVAPELENVTGGYFSNCKKTNEANAAKSDEDAKRLWKISEELTGLKNAEE